MIKTLEKYIYKFQYQHRNRSGSAEKRGNNITGESNPKRVGKIKVKKSPGEDKIQNEFLKYRGEYLTHELTKLFNEIVSEKKVPTER